MIKNEQKQLSYKQISTKSISLRKNVSIKGLKQEANYQYLAIEEAKRISKNDVQQNLPKNKKDIFNRAQFQE